MSQCPRLVGSCLDLASPTRETTWQPSHAARLQTHLASGQEKHVTKTISMSQCCRRCAVRRCKSPARTADRLAGHAARYWGHCPLLRPPLFPGGRKRACCPFLHLCSAAAFGQVRRSLMRVCLLACLSLPFITLSLSLSLCLAVCILLCLKRLLEASS